jgi:hypothetical protein
MKGSELLGQILEEQVKLQSELDTVLLTLRQVGVIQALHLKCLTALGSRIDKLREQMNDHEKRFNSFN